MKQTIEGIIKQLVNEVVCELVGSYDDENSRLAEAEENALSAIAKIRVEELPEEKEHKEWCREFMKKGSCNCMNPDYNQALADARERIK